MQVPNTQVLSPTAVWSDAIENLNLRIQSPDAIPEFGPLLERTLLLGGKRLRPLICFLIGRFFELSPDKVAVYARAAELTHAATLSHDDVIDESDTRRNRPTLNKESSNAKAVLAGDILLARVVRETIGAGNIRIVSDLADVLEDLSCGEWLQLDNRFSNLPTRLTLETIANRKTMSLIAWCCTTPARIANQEDYVVDLCGDFGRFLGLSFQMIDDILDFETQSEKPFALDLQEGQINFVTLEILEAQPSYRDVLQKCMGPGNLVHAPWTQTELDLAKERVRERAQALLREAEKILNELCRVRAGDSEAEYELRGILSYLGLRKH